jgi:superfamily II DNA/RNA helicase
MHRFFSDRLLRKSRRQYSSFKDCFVKNEELLTRLTELNITKPSPVQVAMLPALISHKDIIIKDQTGSGKSLGLLIGLLSKKSPQINKGVSDFAQRRLKNKQYLSYMIILPTRFF